MANIYLTPEFVSDLVKSNDKSFLQRVIKSVFDTNADFRIGDEDHKYKGIEGAWIRKVSGGSSAFRLIYIRKGGDIYLYRAGPHSIEDNLAAPKSLDSSIGKKDLDVKNISSSHAPVIGHDFGELLVTQRRFEEFLLIPDYLHRMFHVGHDEIVLVSPFIDHSLFTFRSAMGRFLDQQLEENALVTIITKPPTADDEYRSFESMASRGMEVLFYKSLHAKLYLFEINEETLTRYDTNQVSKVAILGSSNLTEMGLGFEKDNKCNEELCYRPEDYRYQEFRDYVHRLTINAQDFVAFKNSARRF